MRIEYYEENSVNVSDMIKALKKLPKDAKVYLVAAGMNWEELAKPYTEYREEPKGYYCIGTGYVD